MLYAAKQFVRFQEWLTSQAALLTQLRAWLRYQLYALVGLGVLVLALGGASAGR